MLKYIFILLSFNITFAVFSQENSNLPYNKNDKTLLWEISGKGIKKPTYIFGTFHLICKDDIKFSPALKAAIHSSDDIYLELDMDDPSTMMGAFLMMNMKDGTTLKNLYTNEEYSRVERFFKDSIHSSINTMKRMKPFFLESLLYPKMLACKNVTGIEEEVMKIAKSEKKNLKGLETIEFQSSIFDSISYKEQALELLKTIDSINIYKKSFDTMVMVYKNQDLDAIEKLFNKSEAGLEEHQDLLLDNRNRNWVAQLKGIMKKESVFVAVGAGHLVGKKGLLNLLKEEGYLVKPVMNQ